MRNMSRQMGTLLVTGLTSLISSASLMAQDLSFTNHCDNNVSADDQDWIREAYEFVYAHQDRMWAEVSGTSGYGYDSISSTRRGEWADEIEVVVVNCETDACNDHCIMGRHIEFMSGNRIILCPTNIRRYARNGSAGSGSNSCSSGCSNNSVAQGAATMTAPDAAAFALLAGTIAHEVMHGVDGGQNHPGGGATNPVNPVGSAETVGLAMEHVVLSPDYMATIQSIQVTGSASDFDVDLDVSISNRNEYSGPVGTCSIANRQRNNNGFFVTAYLDGALADVAWLNAIHGGAGQTVRLSFSGTTTGSTSEHQVQVIAEDFDQVFELDETNNTSTEGFSVAADLATSVEIAGPYETLSERTVVGNTIYVQNYRRLTYNVEFENLDDNMTSLPATFQMAHTDMWSSGAWTTVDVGSIPALAPGEVYRTQASVDVPFTPAGALEYPVEVSFMARPGSGGLYDSDWSNNNSDLLIDEAYFRPDYRIELQQFDEASLTATCVVKNLGPEAADSVSRTQLVVNGSVAGYTGTKALNVAESTVLTLVGTGYLLATVENTILVRADGLGRIAENDESNNSDSIVIGHNVDLSRPEFGDLSDQLMGELGRYDMSNIYAQQAAEVMDRVTNVYGWDWSDWYTGSSGPFLPELMYDVTSQTLVAYNRYSYKPTVRVR